MGSLFTLFLGITITSDRIIESRKNNQNDLKNDFCVGII